MYTPVPPSPASVAMLMPSISILEAVCTPKLMRPCRLFIWLSPTSGAPVAFTPGVIAYNCWKPRPTGSIAI